MQEVSGSIPLGSTKTFFSAEIFSDILNAKVILAVLSGPMSSLQDRSNTWFCGSCFGSGFHEDATQAGLAVRESLGRIAVHAAA
jgi:predicted NAD/FAD-binding protein